MPRKPNRVRLLLLSDTHGQLNPQILALAGEVDTIVHAGDIGHPDVLTALTATGQALHAVRGNNDVDSKWPANGHTLLNTLDDQLAIDLPGGVLVVEHGDRVNPAARRHELLRARHPQARLIVYGHSHRQVIDDAVTPWVVNPGAAGRSRTYGGAGCVVLTASTQRWELAPFRYVLGRMKGDGLIE